MNLISFVDLFENNKRKYWILLTIPLMQFDFVVVLVFGQDCLLLWCPFKWVQLGIFCVSSVESMSLRMLSESLNCCRREESRLIDVFFLHSYFHTHKSLINKDMYNTTVFINQSIQKYSISVYFWIDTRRKQMVYHYLLWLVMVRRTPANFHTVYAVMVLSITIKNAGTKSAIIVS